MRKETNVALELEQGTFGNNISWSFVQTHNQYHKEYRDLHIRSVVSCEEISLLEPIDPSKQSTISWIKLTFHHRFANITNHHNDLISRIIPAPDTLMMRVVCLDKWVIRHS